MTTDQRINLMASEWHSEEYVSPIIYMDDDFEAPANVHIQCFQCDKQMYGYIDGTLNMLELMVKACDECSDS